MPDPRKDRAIDGLARRQHGVFHHRQAVRIGFTRAERRSRLASGRWIRLLDSPVFALPSHPGTWLRQCSAATLSVPGSGVSGPAAAALHGFPGWPRAGLEVAARRGGTHVSPFADVRERCTVGRLTVVEGIRVVSPADTLIQIAPGMIARELGALVDDVGPRHRALLSELRDRYAALANSRLPGRSVVHEVLAERGAGYVPATSELNRRLQEFLGGLALPPVVFEHTPHWCEPGAQLVDGWIAAWKLIVEADGRAWHTRVADFERDRERDAVALAHGYATLRLSWHQLVHRSVWCRNVLLAIGAERVNAASSGAPSLWTPVLADVSV